jgi:hypothetical protein
VFNPGHLGEFSGLIVNIETETKRIQGFVDKGNYHAAYNIALSGLNACRRANDQPGTDRFIEIIRGVVESLAREFGSQPASR